MPVSAYWVALAPPSPGDPLHGRFSGPWVNGTDLYAITADTGPNTIRIWRSTDLGVTWAEQDDANHPTGQSSSCWMRDGNIIRVAYYLSGPAYVVLRDFDLTTNTWGPEYADIGSPAFQNSHAPSVVGMLVLGNGAIRLFYTRVVEFPALNGNWDWLYFADYLGGAWTVDLIISPPAPDTKEVSPSYGFLYTGGLSHGFFAYRAATSDYFHFSITDAGVVTIDAAACYSEAGGSNGKALYNPILVGGDFKVAYLLKIGASLYPALLTGSPAAAPVWTSETVQAVDAVLSTNGGVWATENGGEIRVWWARLNQFFYSIRNGAWGAAVLYWDRTANPPVPDPAPTFSADPSITVYADDTTFGGRYGVILKRVNGGPVYLMPAPVAPPAPVISLLGGTRKQVIVVPNHFDFCLSDELSLTRSIDPKSPVFQALTIDQQVWMRAPANSLPFRKIGTIATPLALSGDVEVVAFQIPANYDGVISGIFNLYIGPGFMEGSGDIEWRLVINKVFAMYLGRITTTLGRRQQSYPVDGGVEIRSGNWIRYLVNVPNLSGGILPLNSQIVCGMEGRLYARQ